MFDTSLIPMLGLVQSWLRALQGEIAKVIEEHLEGWSEVTSGGQIVGIDVSWLVAKRVVDVTYSHEAWGDLGINVVITDGHITDSYAGD